MTKAEGVLTVNGEEKLPRVVVVFFVFIGCFFPLCLFGSVGIKEPKPGASQTEPNLAELSRRCVDQLSVRK